MAFSMGMTGETRGSVLGGKKKKEPGIVFAEMGDIFGRSAGAAAGGSGSYAADLGAPQPSDFDSFVNRRLANAGEMFGSEGADGTKVRRFAEGEFKGKTRKEAMDELAKEHRYGKAGTAARKAGELRDRLDGKVDRTDERGNPVASSVAAKARESGGSGRTQGGVEHVDDFYGRQSEAEKAKARKEMSAAVARQRRAQEHKIAADVGRSARDDARAAGLDSQFAERAGVAAMNDFKAGKPAKEKAPVSVADRTVEKPSGFVAELGDGGQPGYNVPKKKKRKEEPVGSGIGA